ncbi:MAG: hypothetical protein NT099_04565 [Candidatus Saganbacteria bacterium]|nr:hypothetical protein [Candidatus Saganbacteria bacterium]
MEEMIMKRPQEHERVKTERPDLPFFFGIEVDHTTKKSDKYNQKLALFEKILGDQLSTNDTIDEAFTKIVRASLAIEFGPSIVHTKGAKKMIETISRGIRDDHTLRKQALALIYRYTKKAS